MQTNDETIKKLYKDYNYPSASRFSKILKDNNINVTLTEIRRFIDSQSIAQVHKQIQHRRSKYRHFTASFPNETFQLDLLDYQKYSKQNNGYNWILICIDIFTRQAYARPIKKKIPSLVKEAFEDIKEIPRVVFHDDGNEWKGEFLTFLNDNDIINVANDPDHHNALGIIDRFSRTIKTEISKYTKW